MEQFRPVQVVAEDAALATALQAGDEDAVRTLVDRFGGPVFAVMRRVSGAGEGDGEGDREGATRLTIEAFLDAWRTIDDVDPGADFVPWLVTIACRVLDMAAAPVEVDVVWNVRAAVDALGPSDRDVVRLRAVERCTGADISAQLGVSGEVVEERLARADRRLANRLEPLGAVAGAVDIDAVLADPTTWEAPPTDLADRVVAAIGAEAGVIDAADIATTGGGRPAWIRPAALGALGAIVVLFGTVVVLSALSGTDGQATIAVELTSTGAIVDAAGEIELSEVDAGLAIELTATNLPRRVDGAFYQAWVVTVDGSFVPVGTFSTGGVISLAAGVELDGVELFVITREVLAGGDGGAQPSSGDVVFRRGDRSMTRLSSPW